MPSCGQLVGRSARGRPPPGPIRISGSARPACRAARRNSAAGDSSCCRWVASVSVSPGSNIDPRSPSPSISSYTGSREATAISARAECAHERLGRRPLAVGGKHDDVCVARASRSGALVSSVNETRSRRRPSVAGGDETDPGPDRRMPFELGPSSRNARRRVRSAARSSVAIMTSRRPVPIACRWLVGAGRIRPGSRPGNSASAGSGRRVARDPGIERENNNRVSGPSAAWSGYVRLGRGRCRRSAPANGVARRRRARRERLVDIDEIEAERRQRASIVRATSTGSDAARRRLARTAAHSPTPSTRARPAALEQRLGVDGAAGGFNGPAPVLGRG